MMQRGGLIRYSDFVQRVRRYRPSELLPALAATAIQLSDKAQWTADRIRLPWSLAAAAKVSIVAGNEFRASGVTDQDVLEICAAYNALEDPLTRDTDDLSGTVGAFLVRTSHEQFGSQQSWFEEISRLGALFEAIEDLDTELLDTSLIEHLLGGTVAEFVGAGMIIGAGATNSGGFFDPEWEPLWSGPRAVDQQFSMTTVRAMFYKHFLTDFTQFQALAAGWSQTDAALRHHEFNPLVSRPFVTLPDGRHIAPQPSYAYGRLCPSAVYYAGVDALNEVDAQAFTRDIGVVFQDYVGRQLKLLPDAVVLPEVHYDNDQRSVDWFVIFDELVLLIEAKSTRLSNLARMGGNALEGDVERSLGKAFKQLGRTEKLLRDGQEAFAQIPTDRPRLGMVVTLEPYWSANSTFVRELLPEPALPVTVASIRELEHFIDVVRGHGDPQVLSEVLADPERRVNTGRKREHLLG